MCECQTAICLNITNCWERHMLDSVVHAKSKFLFFLSSQPFRLHFSFTLLSPSQKRKRVPSPVGRPLQRMLAPTSQSLFFPSSPAPPLPQMAWKRYGCYEAACNLAGTGVKVSLFIHTHLHTSLCPQTHTYTPPALCTHTHT